MACAWLAAFVALHPCAAADPAPLATQLLTDARDGRLDRLDFLSACLIAGGTDDADQLAARRASIADAVGRAALPPPAADFHARAAALHAELHRTILTGRYDKHASDLSGALATGDYNCLTATALYVELCRRAGLPLAIYAQPGHVFCVVGSPPLRIEPACIATGSAVARPFAHAATTPARRITPIQLAARFAYNRGIELLERRQFEPGIAALRLACQLDPHDASARTNLLAGLNNWALALVEQDQPAAAAALIARGLALDPHFAPLVANKRFIADRLRASGR